jgi:hypothetical protein
MAKLPRHAPEDPPPRIEDDGAPIGFLPNGEPNVIDPMLLDLPDDPESDAEIHGDASSSS